MLSASMGLHRLLYAALLNPVLDADTAMRQGLVAEVVGPDEFDERVRRLTELLAASSADSLAATKHLIRRQALLTPGEALQREQAALVSAAGTADAAEGLAAFVEKRRPSFA